MCSNHSRVVSMQRYLFHGHHKIRLKKFPCFAWMHLKTTLHDLYYPNDPWEWPPQSWLASGGPVLTYIWGLQCISFVIIYDIGLSPSYLKILDPPLIRVRSDNFHIMKQTPAICEHKESSLKTVKVTRSFWGCQISTIEWWNILPFKICFNIWRKIWPVQNTRSAHSYSHMQQRLEWRFGTGLPKHKKSLLSLVLLHSDTWLRKCSMTFIVSLILILRKRKYNHGNCW